VYYQQNLRVQLQERRNRLYKAVMETYQNELKYLLDFIKKTPYVRGLVQELTAAEPSINWPDWKAAHFQSSRTFHLPDNEIALAKISYGMLCECAEDKQAAWNYGLCAAHGQGNNITSYLRAFTEVFAQPFFDYLHARIEEGSNVVYLLEKYKRRTEWFHADELFDRALADTAHSEDILDENLREYLFDQGIEHPFSSPRSPSGKADVVADTGEDKPLVLEVKIFDLARNYDKAYVRKGFRQIYDYCGDYNQTAGYLLIFNCSDLNLTLTTARQGNWPPRIHVGHRTIFVVVVDLKQPDRPASKRGPLNPYNIEESYLIAELPAEHS
jgi:hypothetical protein